MTSSTSRDAAIRQAEREGGWLLARYRAGLLEVAYSCAPDVACQSPPRVVGGRYYVCVDGEHWRDGQKAAHMDPCEDCGGTGRVPADPEDLLRLLAFLDPWCSADMGEAIEALSPNECVICGWVEDEDIDGLCSGCANMDYGSPMRRLEDWTARLSRLCAKPPARRAEGKCREGKRHNHGICEPCNGTGKVHQDVPAERWLLVAACVAVGRECCAALKCSRESNTCFCTGLSEYEDCPVILADKALGAAEAWVAEPTRERWRQWEQAGATWQPTGLPAWVLDAKDDNALHALQAASEVLDETRVRELVCAEVVRKVLGQAWQGLTRKRERRGFCPCERA